MMEIKHTENSVILTKDEKSLYITKRQDGFSIESNPYDKVVTFEIVNGSDIDEAEVYYLFEELMKGFFGSYMLYGNYGGDREINVNHLWIRFMSDGGRGKFFKIAFDRKNFKIVLTIECDDISYRNNRIFFDYDCNLRMGFYPCFKNFFQKLYQLSEIREEGIKRVRKVNDN